MPRLGPLLVAVAALMGCSSDLPPASVIDKLRVLAVQAEPPEIAPGADSALTVLAVEPPRLADAQLSARWAACALPPTGLADAPCGIGPDASTSGIQLLENVACMDKRMLCSRYTAKADALGGADSIQVLLTVVIADETTHGADGCVADIMANGGLPKSPDHCVVSIKRLSIAKTPANHNPALADFSATNPVGFTQDLSPGAGHWYPPPHADRDQWDIIAHRSDDSAERKADGTYEALSVSWFVTGGHFDGGRSIFLPPGCNDPAACATELPETGADTTWFTPTEEQAAPVVGKDDGAIDFWAVIRDDRGGVGWRTGQLVRN